VIIFLNWIEKKQYIYLNSDNRTNDVHDILGHEKEYYPQLPATQKVYSKWYYRLVVELSGFDMLIHCADELRKGSRWESK